jgi:hypothetical protein
MRCALCAHPRQLGVVTCWTPPKAPKAASRVRWVVLAARGSVACVAIAVSVVVAHVSPSAGGFLATFPAIFLTTMVSLWLSQVCEWAWWAWWTGDTEGREVGVSAPRSS